jgi:hypothetical protein
VFQRPDLPICCIFRMAELALSTVVIQFSWRRARTYSRFMIKELGSLPAGEVLLRYAIPTTKTLNIISFSLWLLDATKKGLGMHRRASQRKRKTSAVPIMRVTCIRAALATARCSPRPALATLLGRGSSPKASPRQPLSYPELSMPPPPPCLDGWHRQYSDKLDRAIGQCGVEHRPRGGTWSYRQVPRKPRSGSPEAARGLRAGCRWIHARRGHAWAADPLVRH